MRCIQGIDVSALPGQFDGVVHGRTLILDGDGPCYVAAATAKRLDTALRNFQQHVLQAMFMAKAQDCNIHLTASGSQKHGRFRVVAEKPYQGNRDNKAKPSLLEPLRELVADRTTWLDEFTVQLHRELEADDGMMQDAYRLGENGIIRSEDKDLRMTPYPYYEIDRGQVMPSAAVGFLKTKLTGSGVVKLLGQGPLFFWAQMLMGDTADNIKGVRKLNGKLCGPAAAYAALKDCTNINDAANIVVDAYRAENQNVLAEGWLLWLTRYPGDNILRYLGELELSEVNKDFVADCRKRKWVIPKEDTSARDTND